MGAALPRPQGRGAKGATQQVFMAFLLGNGRPGPKSNHLFIPQIFIELSGEEQDYQTESVIASDLRSLQSSGKGQWAKLCHLPGGRSPMLVALAVQVRKEP